MNHVGSSREPAARRYRLRIAEILVLGFLGSSTASAQGPGPSGDDIPVRRVPTLAVPDACSEPQCAARSELDKGSRACTKLIDDLAADPEFGWVLRRQGGLFDRHEWPESSGRVVRYRGDRIRFHASLGSWTRLVYECDFDLGDERVVGVRAQLGQLRMPDGEAMEDAPGPPADVVRSGRAAPARAEIRTGEGTAVGPPAVAFGPVQGVAAGTGQDAARPAHAGPAAERQASPSRNSAQATRHRRAEAEQARGSGKQLRGAKPKRNRAEASAKPVRAAKLKRANARAPAKLGRAVKLQPRTLAERKRAKRGRG